MVSGSLNDDDAYPANSSGADVAAEGGGTIMMAKMTLTPIIAEMTSTTPTMMTIPMLTNKT